MVRSCPQLIRPLGSDRVPADTGAVQDALQRYDAWMSPPVLHLAIRQLAAYNEADLEAFCACYHPQVRVLDVDGAASITGMEAFRARYAEMFANHVEIEGRITGRLVLAPHVVEAEAWSRRNRATGEVSAGEVLVRYTERDGLIAVVEFLRGPPAAGS